MTEQMITSAMVAQDRVTLGLEWINQHATALGLDAARIDRDALDVNSVTLCPLAQAAGRGWFTVNRDAVAAGLAPFEPGYYPYESYRWAADHGFLPDALVNAPTLDAAWRRVLAS